LRADDMQSRPRLPAYGRQGVSCRRPAGLDGGRGETRRERSALEVEMHDVAGGEDVGSAGNRQFGQDMDPASAIEGTPTLLATLATCTPAAQNTVRAAIRSPPASTPPASIDVTVAPVRTSSPYGPNIRPSHTLYTDRGEAR
jgi:hypothetical protein